MTVSTLDLEHQLRASLELIRMQKAALVAERAAAFQPSVSGEMTHEPSALFLMPSPPAGGSEIPAILSPSSTNTFLDCQVRWYYKKVLKLPETRGAALGLGTAVHAALLENFRQKIETKEDLDTDGVRALFIRSLTEQLDELKLQPDETADDLCEAGEVMVRVYMDQAAPRIEPAAVEESVEGEIGGVPVHGYIDIRDVDGRVIDIKTAKKKPSGITPAHMLQLSTYAMLDPLASGAATLATLTKTKTVALHQETVDILPRDRKLAETLYSMARDQMHAGVYAPSRSSFLCSRRHCSYWQRCEAEHGGEVSA